MSVREAYSYSVAGGIPTKLAGILLFRRNLFLSKIQQRVDRQDSGIYRRETRRLNGFCKRALRRVFPGNPVALLKSMLEYTA